MKTQRVADNELEVCHRLRQIRNLMNLTQLELASEIGIQRQRLASYEEGRAPVRWDLALRICRRFLVSEKWLATGQGHMRQYLSFKADYFGPKVPADAPYSVVYRDFIERSYEARLSAHPDSALLMFSHHEDQVIMEHVFTAALALWKSQLSESARGKFFGYLLSRASHFMQNQELVEETNKAAEQSPATGFFLVIPLKVLPQLTADSTVAKPPPQPSLKSSLTTTSDFRISSAEMKSALKELLDKVRRLTRPTGMKAKLASDLGVPQARVSEWLSGKHDPAGETTLQLLRWVELQERQAK